MKAEDVMSAQDFFEQAKSLVTFISCKDYKSAQRRDVDHVILDVRTKEEFEAGHIDEALHIPRGKLEFEILKAVPNKNAPIMACCGTGKRAALAALTLQKMGYSNVRVLEDGYEGYCEIDEDGK